jgi:hypothetical protein
MVEGMRSDTVVNEILDDFTLQIIYVSLHTLMTIVTLASCYRIEMFRISKQKKGLLIIGFHCCIYVSMTNGFDAGLF